MKNIEKINKLYDVTNKFEDLDVREQIKFSSELGFPTYSKQLQEFFIDRPNTLENFRFYSHDVLQQSYYEHALLVNEFRANSQEELSKISSKYTEKEKQTKSVANTKKDYIEFKKYKNNKFENAYELGRYVSSLNDIVNKPAKIDTYKNEISKYLLQVDKIPVNEKWYDTVKNINRPSEETISLADVASKYNENKMVRAVSNIVSPSSSSLASFSDYVLKDILKRKDTMI